MPFRALGVWLDLASRVRTVCFTQRYQVQGYVEDEGTVVRGDEREQYFTVISGNIQLQ